MSSLRACYLVSRWIPKRQTSRDQQGQACPKLRRELVASQTLLYTRDMKWHPPSPLKQPRKPMLPRFPPSDTEQGSPVGVGVLYGTTAQPKEGAPPLPPPPGATASATPTHSVPSTSLRPLCRSESFWVATAAAQVVVVAMMAVRGDYNGRGRADSGQEKRWPRSASSPPLSTTLCSSCPRQAPPGCPSAWCSGPAVKRSVYRLMVASVGPGVVCWCMVCFCEH